MSWTFFWLFAFCICFGAVSFGQAEESEEQMIRNMVAQRPSAGSITAPPASFGSCGTKMPTMSALTGR